MLREVLQQNAAGPMHDAFWNAGGSGGIENIERMIERQACIVDRVSRLPGPEIAERLGIGQPLGEALRRPDIVDDHHLLDRWQLLQHRLDLRAQLEDLAAIGIAVAGNEDPRLDLANRSRIPRSPKSGEQDDHTPPSDAVARKNAVVSGIFGTIAAIRSPALRPSRRNPWCISATVACNSFHDSSRLGLCSLRKINAGVSSALTSKFCA